MTACQRVHWAHIHDQVESPCWLPGGPCRQAKAVHHSIKIAAEADLSLATDISGSGDLRGHCLPGPHDSVQNDASCLEEEDGQE